MTRKFRDVPHVEIRRTQVLQCEDTDVVVNGAHAALPLLREILSGREQESFICLMLDVHNRVTAWREVARGSAESVQVPVRDLFRMLLTIGAHGAVVGHNHPSGDPRPSQADIRITAALKAAGELLQIPILDHIIVGDGESYYSFANGGVSLTSVNTLLTGPRQGPELD